MQGNVIPQIDKYFTLGLRCRSVPPTYNVL